MNPLMAIDFYKADHRRQYPQGTTEIYSNFTPRFVIKNVNLPNDFDNHVVLFGLQYVIQKFLIDDWDVHFFDKPKFATIPQYKKLMEESLGVENFDVSHIEALHSLGYLPLQIKSYPEGTLVPIGVPVLTIKNTHPDFFWLTNYVESILSAMLWKPITVATIAHQIKKVLNKFADETCDNNSHVPFQAHDFSFRGMSGYEDARICGAAHLLSFLGTDSVGSIELLQQYYKAKGAVGFSVPATEHSCACINGVGGEEALLKHLITEIYPKGIFSFVADSYDYWNVITNILPSLKDVIMARDGKLVVRADSGDQIKIICGDWSADVNSPEFEGTLNLLWGTFGGTINSKGYKVLDPHIGLIYGDGMNLKKITDILISMELMGFASSNIVFGVGSYTYNFLTRDNFGFAMKATSAVVNGERRAIFKDPKTGSSKKSAKGLLRVDRDEEGRLVLTDDVSEEQEQLGELETIFHPHPVPAMLYIYELGQHHNDLKSISGRLSHQPSPKAPPHPQSTPLNLKNQRNNND